MAQGEFTKSEADNAIECVKTLVDGLPKRTRAEYIGEVNELFLFLEVAKKAAAEG